MKKRTKTTTKPNGKVGQARLDKRASERDANEKIARLKREEGGLLTSAKKPKDEQFTGETKLATESGKLDKEIDVVTKQHQERPAAPEQGVNRDSF